jgi:hypothetical protein
MNRVIHFEIQANEPERAAKFYREVFGWEIRKYEGPDLAMEYWMVMTAPEESKEPGINGGLVRRPAPPPSAEQGTNAFVCTVAVENFDQMAEKIGLAGGLVAMPKFPIPGMAWQGYFLDPEGNTFGIHQPDPSAK